MKNKETKLQRDIQGAIGNDLPYARVSGSLAHDGKTKFYLVCTKNETPCNIELLLGNDRTIKKQSPFSDPITIRCCSECPRRHL